jgi:LPS-assembly protein
LLIAIGNVEITQGASRLLADRVELNRDTGEAVAQGKVVFFDGQDRLVGDRVDYNLKTGTGVVYNGSTFTAPYYHLSGERMDRIGDGIYRVRRGVFTTCEGDEPDWSFRIGSATADLSDIVYGTNASFWVRSIPVIPFVPFFAAALRRERQSGFLFPEYGTSSSKGMYAKIPYYWAISDSQDLTVSLDAYSKRGVGVEGEYRYILSRQARGIFTGFVIPELWRDKADRARLDIPEVRGLLSYQHDWQITPRLSLKVDANATTDDLVYREYGDRLADRARQRAETNVFLTQRWDSWSLTGNVLWYQDLTTPVAVELQRVPEIKLFGLRQPVPGAPVFLYETEASLTNFYRVVGDGGVRLDVHPRAFLPVPVAGLFTLTPFAGGRVTYYNQRAVGARFTHTTWVEDTIHEDRARLQAEGGIEAASRASRVFALDGWGGLAAVQHLIEPRATLEVIRGINQKANPQYDPAIDNIGRVTHVTYSITNRLNAKTLPVPGAEVVRWEAARVALTQVFDIDRAIHQGRQPFKDLQGDLIIDPNAIFRFRAEAAYNMYGLGLRSASTDLTARYRDVALTVGSRYDEIGGTHVVVGEATARLLHNLDGHVGTNWDVRTNTLVEQRFGIDWRFQCFAILAEYVYRHKSEDELRFSINLLGVGQAGTKVGTGQ